MDRRRFLSWTTAALSAALAAVVGVPVVGRLLGPLRRRDDEGADRSWVALGPADAFTDERPRRVTFTVSRRDGWEIEEVRQAAWVRRQGDGFVVLSTVCPHLGCSIDWLKAAGAFECPCHDSQFAPDGERRYGPARRGMDPLPHRVRGGLLEVEWIEFAPGTEERRPLGVA